MLLHGGNKLLVPRDPVTVRQLVTGHVAPVNDALDRDDLAALEDANPVLAGKLRGRVLVNRPVDPHLGVVLALPVKVGGEVLPGRDVGAIGQLITQIAISGLGNAHYLKGWCGLPCVLPVRLLDLTFLKRRLEIPVKRLLEVNHERLEGRLIGLLTTVGNRWCRDRRSLITWGHGW